MSSTWINMRLGQTHWLLFGQTYLLEECLEAQRVKKKYKYAFHEYIGFVMFSHKSKCSYFSYKVKFFYNSEDYTFQKMFLNFGCRLESHGEILNWTSMVHPKHGVPTPTGQIVRNHAAQQEVHSRWMSKASSLFVATP